MSEDVLLRVRDLRVMIGHATVVDGVDLDVGAGEAIGLVGESGCGKTTTLRAVLQLLPPAARVSGGEISFRGRDLLRATPGALRRIRGRGIGVVWQDPLAALDPLMRVGAQIAETVRAHEAVTRKAAAVRALELMRLVELPDVARAARAYPHELSGGQRQRVVIACAIASTPALLLADEPTTALDVTVQAQILALLSRLRRDLGLAIVLVSHDLAVVNQTCDRIAVMYGGRVVETGSTHEVLTAPAHPYTQGLLRAAPSVDDIGTLPEGIPGTASSSRSQGCAFGPRCSRVDERCQQLPLLRIAGQGGGHSAACWHPYAAAATPAGTRD